MADRAGGDSRTQGEALEERILRAAATCVGRWGVAKTTLDDVAREAGCSRATVYRVFPGGKDVVLLASAAREFNGFLAELDRRLADASSLEAALVDSITFAGRTVREHPVLAYLRVHEPELLAPFMSFDGLDPVLVRAMQLAGPHLGRFVDDTTARRLGELAARIVVLYGFDDPPTVDLADPAAVGRLVRTYVLPAAVLPAAVLPEPATGSRVTTPAPA